MRAGVKSGPAFAMEDVTRPSRGIAAVLLETLLCVSFSSFAGCGRGISATAPGGLYEAGPIFTESVNQFRHTFSVVNTTGNTVKIMGVTTTCGCTTARLGKHDLAPGEATELELTSNTLKGSYGKASLSCTLNTDHERFRQWTYTVRYDNIPHLAVSPTHHDLGILPKSTPSARWKPRTPYTPVSFTVDVFARDRDVDVADLQSPLAEGFIVDLEPTSSSRDIGKGIHHRRFELRVALKEPIDGATGTFSRSIPIVAADGTKRFASVSWTSEAPVSAAPSAIHFGAVSLGGRVTTSPKRLVLRSTDGVAFRILAVDSSPETHGTVRLADGTASDVERTSHDIALVYSLPKGRSDQMYTGRIRIRTNRTDHPVVSIPWSAFVGRSTTGEVDVTSRNEGIPVRRFQR